MASDAASEAFETESSTSGIALPPTVHLWGAGGAEQGLRERTTSTPSDNSITDAARTRSLPGGEPRRKRWFELCVNRGEGRRSLGEIPLEHIQNDGEVFRATRSKYESIRGFRIRKLYLLKPVDIRFVRVSTPKHPSPTPGCATNQSQFFLEDRHRVFIHEKPKSWPSQDDIDAGRWEFDHPPKHQPPVPPPPINAEVFLHYMNAPEGHRQARWLPRLPKKLQRSMADEALDLPMGWGVLVVEGLDKTVATRILWITVSLVFTLGTAWSIYKQQSVNVAALTLAFLTIAASFVTSKVFEQLDA